MALASSSGRSRGGPCGAREGPGPATEGLVGFARGFRAGVPGPPPRGGWFDRRRSSPAVAILVAQVNEQGSGIVPDA